MASDKTLCNRQIAGLFQQMADVMQILGETGFKVNAFARAARSIDDLAEELATIGPDAKKLATLDGIGKGMADRIAEMLTTGDLKEYHQLMSQVPEGLPALLEIPGLGPKTIALMWHEAGVDSIDTLKAKLDGDELTRIKGMGAKKIENIRKNLTFTEQAGGRVRIGQAMPLARWLVDRLRKVEGVIECDYAGSLRRGKETIGDVDILVAANEKDAAAISKAFVGFEPFNEVLVQGATKTSVRTSADVTGGQPMQVDLRIVGPDSYGAALMYFTGSKEHNVSLRERAIKQGMKLSEWGLFKGDDVVASKSEAEVYKALGLPLIAPELREDRGEIKLAEKDELPELISLGDIKAELHSHTTASDGKWTIREIARAAIDRGFHTLAITDHSKSQAQANGLSDERLEQHIRDIREVAAELKGQLTLLAGSEVDILADGKLDYPNSLLKELDIVVASPHSALSQDGDKATKRLLKGMENRYVTILGHPTGRLINRREGLSPDIKQIIKAAVELNVALEINANSWRLDLRDTHARAALEAGAKLAINTDAHSATDLEQLRYGILTARRAGATAKDVINCMNADDLAKWLTIRGG